LNSRSGIDKDNDKEAFALEELKKTIPELCDFRDVRDADAEVRQKDWLSMIRSYTNTMPTLTLCK
jgi:hypothetical protein